MISAKVRKIRGKKHEGYPSPTSSPAWANVSDETFAAAVDGVRDLRIARLARLRAIVERHASERCVHTAAGRLPLMMCNFARASTII
eukprot:SAG31_NODE_2656_length_5289_cov_1.990366_3_plen_87_part_00